MNKVDPFIPPETIKIITTSTWAIMATAKCWKLGQWSPLEVGEDDSKFEPKELRKI